MPTAPPPPARPPSSSSSDGPPHARTHRTLLISGSQFFITTVPATWLDNKHTVSAPAVSDSLLSLAAPVSLFARGVGRGSAVPHTHSLTHARMRTTTLSVRDHTTVVPTLPTHRFLVA